MASTVTGRPPQRGDPLGESLQALLRRLTRTWTQAPALRFEVGAASMARGLPVVAVAQSRALRRLVGRLRGAARRRRTSRR